ncbi:MAG: YkvA family protein [Bdellovibrionota bacterium]
MPTLLHRAEHLLKHPEELLQTLGDALKKAYSKRSVLIHIFEDFLLLFRFVKAWVTGEYREMPKTSVFWALFAILYFLSPIDLIPDIFPGGYLDDIAIISFVLKRIKADLDKYSAWEKKKS